MKIKWNEVTRTSQIAALVLFVVVYFLGMYVGMQVEKKKEASQVPEWAKELSAAMKSNASSTAPISNQK